MRPSIIFELGDIVVVPFPLVDQPRLRRRPALVISAPQLAQQHGLLWVLMITTAANGGWASDVSLAERFAECGLSVPCVIRTAKLSTVDAHSADRIGALPRDIWDAVQNITRSHLAVL